jgi:hypothetical protein
MPPVRSLTIHADYQCQHAGACCRAGWPIPIDEALQRVLDAARASGRLVMPVLQDPHESCAYYETRGRNEGGLCAIHRQLGGSCKPPSCRHFPRVALLDARGVSITLSHYCPTAASMLFRTDVTLGITDAPPAFPQADEYEGLDARNVMPPLLRPGMLWDYDGYSEWERRAIALLAIEDLAPEDAIDWLRRIAAAIKEWRQGSITLADHVAIAFGCVPRGPRIESAWGERRTVVNRYLAARLFASWVPYRADRLSALIDDLAATHSLLLAAAARGNATLTDAIRATELRTVHAAG